MLCTYSGNFQDLDVWLLLLYLTYSDSSPLTVTLSKLGATLKTVLQWTCTNVIVLTLRLKPTFETTFMHPTFKQKYFCKRWIHLILLSFITLPGI